MPTPAKDFQVFTIGHSNRPLTEFIEMLQKQGVILVADVRTVPRSRHNPQYNRETLPASLKTEGVAYVHVPGLGGWRSVRPDSPNRGWRSSGFQGFADYMLTSDFEANLKALIELAQQERLALMCAEALPWHCHRSLIADALVVRDIPVTHIIGPASCQPHRLNPMARVLDGRITYPPPEKEP